MKTKMSSKEKIVLGIVIASVAFAVVILIIILSGGGLAKPVLVEPDMDTNDVIEEVAEPEKAAEPEDDGVAAVAGDETGSGADGGVVAFDYNDPSTYIQSIPDPKALDEMYVLLEGYWITDDYPFVGFIKKGGEHWIEYGAFQTSWGRSGKITGGFPSGKFEAALDILIPAQEATEMDDAQPARAETIYVDLSDLVPNTKIKVKIGGLEDIGWSGGWITYEPGGATLEQAFNNWWDE